jgi:Mor family transcriptional regulator
MTTYKNYLRMNNEIEWRVIPSFPNYEASNTGLIRRVKTQKVLKSKNIDSRQYQVVSLFYRKKYTKKVSRLIYEAFNDCECEMTIDHIDRNILNNNLSNLRCVSIAENHKNRTIYKSKNKYGLTDDIKMEIIINYRAGKLTTWDIMKKYNLPSNYISSVIKRGSWDRIVWRSNIKNTDR